MFVRARSSLALAVLAVAIAFGCGGGKKEAAEPTISDATAGETGGEGEATGQGEGAAAVAAGDVARGASVFADACATCHGDEGEGSKKTPAVVGANALKKYADDKALFAYLKKDMPKDDPGSLSDQEYTDVIAWLRSK
jgi:cytochrome c